MYIYLIAIPVPLRWNSTGTTVAGITNSIGANASQVYGPYGLAWDSSGDLYIADYINNRIQKWIIGESVGKTIAGQANGQSGNDSSHLYRPVGIFLDSNDNLFVIERYNHRLQYWPKDSSTGSTIAGISGKKNIFRPVLLYKPDGWFHRFSRNFE